MLWTSFACCWTVATSWSSEDSRIVLPQSQETCFCAMAVTPVCSVSIVVTHRNDYKSDALPSPRRDLGKSMEPPMLRVHLSGRLTIDADGIRLGPNDFPG